MFKITNISRQYFAVFLFLILSCKAHCTGSASSGFYDLKFLPIQSEILPSNDVRKLFQDSDGFVWLPTYNGLARFDGYNVLTFEIIDENERIVNTCINVVEEDEERQMWIGTERGLYVLDKFTGNIAAVNSSELLDCNIADLLIDSENNLWVGTNKGLYRKRKGEEDFQKITYEDLSLSITSITEDGNKNLWITGWDQGVYKYSIRSGKFRPFNDGILKKSHVIFTDTDHNLWIGTWGEGLLVVTNDKGNYESGGELHYKQYKHIKGSDNCILDNIIYEIEQDDISGSLWIGSRSGLTILHRDAAEPSFENYVPDNNFGGLPFNEVNSILKTKDSAMWIGMLGGGVCKAITGDVNVHAEELNSVRERYQTSSVKSILYDEEEFYWMGIAGYGMIRYNSTDDSFLNYNELPSLKSLPYTSLVNTIIKRELTGEICFGTWNNGVWIYNKLTGDMKTITQMNESQFVDDCVFVLFEDSKFNLWIGSRNGIYVYTANGVFYTLNEWLGVDAGLNQVQISGIKEDKRGNIWIGTNYKGIIKISVVDKKVRHYTTGKGINVKNINTLFVDTNDRIWAGTIGDGLYYYNPKEDYFLPTTSIPNIEKKSITNIIEDGNKRIWITTNNVAIAFFVNEDYEFENIIYFSDDYSFHEFTYNKNAALKREDGSLIFGGTQGFKIIDSDNISHSEAVWPLALTDLKVNGVSVREGSLPSLKRDINYTDRIILSHTDNNIQIDFALLNYSDIKENIYTYILEGHDVAPLFTGARNYSAVYTNLPAGEYTFRLLGAPEYGDWVREEKLLKIKVLPPPWLSKWAITSYVILFCAIMYFIFRFMRYRIRMNYKVQMSELQRQKAEEVNHAKLQFFTNITHELMTPLTIIAASLENMSKKEMNPLYSMISVQSVRLMRLIQQVLEFKKVESDNEKLVVTYANISYFIKSCVEAFRPLVKRKNLKVTYESFPEEIFGYFDSDKVDKIIYNLLSNATKYTPDGGKITVKLSDTVEGGFQLSVINEGELMDSEKIGHLFSRFYESDHRKFNTIGHGIGLSLVKDLVTIHKGKIAVFSNKEVGNCFNVTLPLKRESYSNEEIDDTIDPDVPSFFIPITTEDEALVELHEDSLSNLTLLIVEDSEDLRQLVSSFFSNYFHVKTASNGVEAINILEEGAIDLIVSDIMMPEMDGIELCRFVKNKFEFCHIPVVLLTAKDTEIDEIEGYNSGADGYVKKPFNFTLLYAQVNNLLKKQERRRADLKKQVVLEIGDLEYTSLDKQFLNDAIECINENIKDTEFDLEKFSVLMGHSKSTLNEKLKMLTGFTPTAFIREIRLTSSYKLLNEEKEIRIDELASAVGFSDPKYFSTCFKKKYGISPTKILKCNISIETIHF